MKKIIYINNNSHNKKKRKIQIIGGKWRGKKITIIQHPDLRPTTNQIRETLFNWLSPIIKGAKCLDCFSGSGILGLEALSRNAKEVTFLEKNAIISSRINSVIQNLHIKKQTKIITTDSRTWLNSSYYSHSNKNKKETYDIVFLDPPFSKSQLIQHNITLLEKFQHLSKNAWIYIENKSTNIKTLTFIAPNTWKLHKKKTTGNVTYQIYIKDQ